LERYKIIWILLVWILALTSPLTWAGEPRTVFVSIAPQKYFVQQIGKDLVTVNVMVPPGASPHTYEPKPRQMAAISRAESYFAIGVSFEKVWLPKIAAGNPHLKVVHTDQAVPKIPMAMPALQDEDAEQTAAHRQKPQGQDHSQGGHHHDRDGHDPHVWLSPPLVRIQAAAILKALIEIDPAHRQDYETNYDRFIAAIDALHQDLKAVFAGREGMQFMVFHPSWGYFADTYALEQVPVEFEGKAPKPQGLKRLIEHARARGIRAIFVQPQFSTRSAELVAREIGGQVVPADPLAEDWAGNLRTIAAKFETALR
jgi:zinc transport system substrate-binding protein